ncbi:MAG: hypothetical protein ACR2IF_13060 [Terriglobales bacterium]
MAFKKRYLGLAALGLAGVLSIPAAAQYQGQEQPRQHDQDDQNRARRDDDQSRNRAGDQDRDRNNGYQNGQNARWRNTKAYKQGFKDGQKDRAKNRGERADRKNWKNDQDRQAYQAGYYDAYRNNTATRDRDDRRREAHDH